MRSALAALALTAFASASVLKHHHTSGRPYLTTEGESFPPNIPLSLPAFWGHSLPAFWGHNTN